VEPAVRTVYGLPYRWGLREASAAYVLGDTSTYKEKKFSAEVVHKDLPCLEILSYARTPRAGTGTPPPLSRYVRIAVAAKSSRCVPPCGHHVERNA
jgi:hypothetical protein